MRAFRATLWQHPDNPMTMVMREVDVTSWTQAVEQASQPMPGGLVIVDTFEMPRRTASDGSVVPATIEEATREAERRLRARYDVERNMAILYLWNGMQLRNVASNGVLQPTLPAPLAPEDIETALRQLAHHPNYRAQTVSAFTEDGVVVTLRAGRVTRGRHDSRTNG